MSQNIRLTIFSVVVILNLACNKKDFLDDKPTSNLVQPSTLSDIQAMLDYIDYSNIGGMNQTPATADLCSDIFYMTTTIWQSRNAIEKNAYVWENDIWGGQSGIGDWNIPYKQIFTANLVLEELNKILPNSSSQSTWNYVKAQALFHRAYAFYHLSQIFCPVFDSL